jgi:hypothetical protein
MSHHSTRPARRAIHTTLAGVLLVALAGLQGFGVSRPVAAAPPTIAGAQIFPPDNVWNRTVADLPVHPNSAAYLNNIGLSAALKADFGSGLWEGGPIGIPYVVVPGSQPKVPIHFTAYGDESDPGPMPIPPSAPVEGGAQSDGDRHMLVVDKDNGVLYELGRAFPNPDGSWNADVAAKWPLNSNALRPDRWTSADAAGLPILAGLARYDEVAAGAITHALRFTVPRTQKAYIWPARHYASSSTDPTRPPMGLRLRLKSSVNISGYGPQARVVLQALKDYGMILADNGSALYVSGAPDERWNNSDLATLRGIKTSDFEAVDESGLMVDPNSAQARAPVAVGPTVGATNWFFAEGYTGAGFDEYLTIQNPNPLAATLQITYYLNGGAPVTKGLTVPASSRSTVAVHDPAQGVGRGKEVSARVVSLNGVGVVVERPMYFTYNGATAGVTGGHNVMGVNAPRQSWLFAEGYTGAGFDQYLTLMNPNPAAAPVTITYYLGGGQAPVVKQLTVPANSRATVTVHDATLGVGRAYAVSARVETTLAGGIVVERPIYFRYAGSMGAVTGGHNVMGAAGPQPAWFFPDGATGAGWDSFLTLMNTSAGASQARLTFYVVGEAAPRTRDLTVPGASRATVALHDAAQGVGRGKSFGVKVETTNGVDLVAERPTYFTYGAGINGGHAALGAAGPRPTWYFAEGYTGAGFDEYLIALNPNNQVANVTITYYLNGAAPVVRSLAVAPNSRATVAVHDAGQVGRGKQVSARVESTNGVGIVVERPIYFTYGGAMDGGHTVLGYAP